MMICDIRNHRVRRIDFKTGLIETFLGTGAQEPTPDGAPIKGTPVNGPRAIDLDPKGNLYLVLREGNRVFRIDPRAGVYLLTGTYWDVGRSVDVVLNLRDSSGAPVTYRGSIVKGFTCCLGLR